MNKYLLGSIVILLGLAYGSMAIDSVYQKTLGWLVENKWLELPSRLALEKSSLGRKPTILLYSIIIVLIGVFILIRL